MKTEIDNILDNAENIYKTKATYSDLGLCGLLEVLCTRNQFTIDIIKVTKGLLGHGSIWYADTPSLFTVTTNEESFDIETIERVKAIHYSLRLELIQKVREHFKNQNNESV